MGNGRHPLGNGKRETGNALVTYWTEWCHQEKDPPTKREREREIRTYIFSGQSGATESKAKIVNIGTSESVNGYPSGAT